MSVTISLKQMVARRNGAALSFIQHCLSVAGILVFFGVGNVLLNKLPADDASSSTSTDSAAAGKPVAGADLSVLSEQPEASLALAELAAVVPAAPSAAAPASAPKPEPTVLSPRMQGALDYVKRRYKVAPEALVPVFEVAQLIGKEMRIDPLLIVAIIGIESGFNPFAESSMGARGLMQIIPRFHRDKVPAGAGDGSLLDPLINIRVGVLVLEEAIRRGGGLVPGLQQYAGSSEPEGLYASKVLAEKERLEQAARRNSPAA